VVSFTPGEEAPATHWMWDCMGPRANLEAVEYTSAVRYGKRRQLQEGCVVTCMSDYRRGFGLDVGLIEYFNTPLVITLNYNAIANLHTLLFTRAQCKYLLARSVFISSFLVTASNNGYFSASGLKSSLNIGSRPTACFPYD
jgi:hypothetical protein